MVSNIADVAKTMADNTRAAILEVLMDGRAYSASDLARLTHVTRQTMSFHLARLVEADFLGVEKWGRHRYYKISNPLVAEIVESLGKMTSEKKVKSLRESEASKAVRYARTCYDHLAGEIGVLLTNALIHMNLIVAVDNDFEVTELGIKRFGDIGIDIAKLRASRRKFAKKCLDWSERQYHIGGALGAEIALAFLENGWVKRLANSRALEVTEAGKEVLAELFQEASIVNTE